MSKKYTILICSIDGVGHFNACIGIGEQLRDRGHKVVFSVPDSWRNKLSPYGFEEEWLNLPKEGEEEKLNLEAWGEMVAKMAPHFLTTPEEQITNMTLVFYEEIIKQAKKYEPRLKEIVTKVKPDIILVDAALHSPAIMDTGIPWILSMSISPTGISNKNVPPAFSGYPCGEEHKKSWENYIKEFELVTHDLYTDFKKWVIDNGGPELKNWGPFFIKYSPYANIYQYPEEMDYTEYRPNPPNFYRFDTFVRSTKHKFEIPEQLKNKPGKLIYFSMGTIGCSELGVMRRLIGILAKSPNRFIMSKGPFADQLELPDNMWGESSLPQTAILPLVDLVITHGGNNTTTESFYFGKPLIVLPLFGDQPDNGQRVMETGHGLQFHPYKVAEQEILEAIEKLLADNKLVEKMAKIGKRIQSANNQSRVADLIEKIARENKI